MITDAEFEEWAAGVTSPPELALLRAVVQACNCPHVEGRELHDPTRGLRFIPQHRLPPYIYWSSPCETRIIDLAVFTVDKRLAVEVDGYEFHYASQELAANTLSRARELVCEGWFHIAFTALEVMRDPLRCAEDLIATARALPHGGDRDGGPP